MLTISVPKTAPEKPEPDIAVLIERMEKAIEARPNDPEGRVLLARAYLGLQRAGEAWPLFRRAAELMGETAPPQIFAQMGIGSTRMEEEKLVAVHCSEA